MKYFQRSGIMTEDLPFDKVSPQTKALEQSHQQSRLQMVASDEFNLISRGSSDNSHSSSISGGVGTDEFEQITQMLNYLMCRASLVDVHGWVEVKSYDASILKSFRSKWKRYYAAVWRNGAIGYFDSEKDF